MPDLKQFRLPDVGEGLTEADILSWTVAPGDVVVVNQTIVEVETAKAAVELPSPFAGVVHSLHAEVGETVEVGRPIITIDVDPGGSPAPAPAPLQTSTSGGGDRQAVLVARLDNLGKGASGAAVQNLGLMLGLDALAGRAAAA